MKRYIRALFDKNLGRKISNKLLVKIGLFYSNSVTGKSNSKTIDSCYELIHVTEEHSRLLEEYSRLNRYKGHYLKNIIPRIDHKERYKGFAILHKLTNRIVYLSWIDFKKITIPEIGFEKDLASKEAYFFDDDCVAKHRRKGLHKLVFAERLAYCKEKSVKKVFIVIYLNNYAAIANLKKFNFSLLRKFKHFPLLSKLSKR